MREIKGLWIIWIIMGVVVLNIVHTPLLVIPTLGHSFANTTIDCYAISGKCIPINQGCGDNLEYGACTNNLVCCVEDKCESTGGKWVFHKRNDNVFEKTCVCPNGEEYNMRLGCKE